MTVFDTLAVVAPPPAARPSLLIPGWGLGRRICKCKKVMYSTFQAMENEKNNNAGTEGIQRPAIISERFYTQPHGPRAMPPKEAAVIPERANLPR